MAKVAFGLALAAIAWVLIAGTDKAGYDLRHGGFQDRIFYSQPTPGPTVYGASPFRFVAPSRRP